MIERSLEGATTWCTNLIFSPKGQLVSRHRKFQPTAAERVIWSQGEKLIDGKEDNLPVVKTELGKVGGLICWESEYDSWSCVIRGRVWFAVARTLWLTGRLHAACPIRSVPAWYRDVRLRSG